MSYERIPNKIIVFIGIGGLFCPFSKTSPTYTNKEDKEWRVCAKNLWAYAYIRPRIPEKLPIG